MTILEAERFTARWRRILIPWQARTDAEAVRDMEKSCFGVVLGMGLVALMAVYSDKLPDSIGALALIVSLFAAWLNYQLRAIRRLFDAVDAKSFADLKLRQ